jgi:hypothetical protein
MDAGDPNWTYANALERERKYWQGRVDTRKAASVMSFGSILGFFD